MNKKDIEVILGIILVILILKYFFMPDILNLISGYDVYSSDCSMKIKHMEPMTLGGYVIDDFCNTSRSVALILIIFDILLMIIVHVRDKYAKKMKK